MDTESSLVQRILSHFSIKFEPGLVDKIRNSWESAEQAAQDCGRAVENPPSLLVLCRTVAFHVLQH